MGSLKVILEELKSMADKARGPASQKISALLKSLDALNGPLVTCKLALEEIDKKLGTIATLTKLGSLTWPLKEKGVQKILDVFQKQNATSS